MRAINRLFCLALTRIIEIDALMRAIVQLYCIALTRRKSFGLVRRVNISIDPS